MRVARTRLVLIPEKYFCEIHEIPMRTFCHLVQYFTRDLRTGSRRGQKVTFLGPSRVGTNPGRNCILRSPVPGFPINFKKNQKNPMRTFLISTNFFPPLSERAPAGVKKVTSHGFQESFTLYWNSLDISIRAPGRFHEIP